MASLLTTTTAATVTSSHAVMAARRSLRLALLYHCPSPSSIKLHSSSLAPATLEMLRSRRPSKKLHSSSSRRKLDFHDAPPLPVASCSAEADKAVLRPASQGSAENRLAAPEAAVKPRAKRKADAASYANTKWSSHTPGRSSLTAEDDCADVVEVFKRRRHSKRKKGHDSCAEFADRKCNVGLGETVKDRDGGAFIHTHSSLTAESDPADFVEVLKRRRHAKQKIGQDTLVEFADRESIVDLGEAEKERDGSAIMHTYSREGSSGETSGSTGCLALVPVMDSSTRPSAMASVSRDSVVDAIDTPILYQGPFPSFLRPSPAECIEVRERLWRLHGPLEEYAKHRSARITAPQVKALECSKPVTASVKEQQTHLMDTSKEQDAMEGLHPRERRTVLDSLVGTILSQNTTDTNSRRAFASLKRKFPTWEEVYSANPKEVEDSIRCGGLAEIKASRILNILNILHNERGKICLEYVRNMAVDEIKLELSRFKGVGPKTIACVLMFHLQQDEFPVDTHVFRITKALGWVPANADREKAYMHLNHRIPNELKFDLHCLLVTHGKRCPRCAKGTRPQQPADGPCPLVGFSPSSLQLETSKIGLLTL